MTEHQEEQLTNNDSHQQIQKELIDQIKSQLQLNGITTTTRQNYSTPPIQMARQIFVLLISVVTAVISILVKRMTDKIEGNVDKLLTTNN